MVIYSEDGTRLQNRILRRDQLRMQLFCNGAYSENIETFVNSLLATGFAEISQRKLMGKFIAV